MRNHKTAFIIFFILIFGILSIAYLGYSMFYEPLTPSRNHSFLYIDRDDNIDSIYHKIDIAAQPHKIIGFKILSHFLDYPQNIKTGKYEMGNGLNNITLIRNLRNKNQVPVRLTIPNVRTMERLSAKLAKVLEADSAEFITYFRDTTVCRNAGYNSATLSCVFIPNTYEVYWDITPERLLKKMSKECKRFWNSERLHKAKDKGLNPIEVMILASIVDQETANNAEKPSIAGMYLNRLRIGMPLQADPTIKFALQQFGIRRILHEHLKVDSPYNTYIYKGLPPGPISIPAISSIDAVLDAENNSYIYMCAKEDFSGTHNFASTYAEHLRNARKYTRALNKRGIK